MIRHRRRRNSADLAVDFLNLLSGLTVEDFIGTYRKSEARDIELFHSAKLEVFQAVEALGDVIPSLLLAGQRIIDKAVATPTICFVMNRMSANPFTIGLGITDVKLHIIAMVVFRQVTLESRETEELFEYFPWMTFSSVILWIAVYHTARKICEYSAVRRLSRSSANRLFFQFWSILDVLSLILATGVCVKVESESEVDYNL